MPSAPSQPAATMRQRVARHFAVDEALPIAVRRPMRRLVLVKLGLPCAILFLFFLELQGIVSPIRVAWVFLAAGVGVFFAWLLEGSAKSALRRAIANDHLLCPACTYDLRSLAEEGACPECGRACEHAAVRAQWLDAQRRFKRHLRARPAAAPHAPAAPGPQHAPPPAAALGGQDPGDSPR
ncbi:MAG: hypothetical protein KIT54_09160 [Phycisphaeraceae bacterium]|nr:hypothetical protein [Phycisphaeraceae bacterium]